MEDAVEYGWKNEYLKYMAKCSMLSGEKELSEKYIKTLSNTLFYKDYARELKGYIDNPETVKNNREFADVLNLCTFDNELAGDESKLELYLLNSFADLT